MPVLIDRVEEITRQSVGLAGMYVRTRTRRGACRIHSGACTRFRRARSGPICRTLIRRVRLTRARHRTLLAKTIDSQPGAKLARILGWSNRSRSLNLPLPGAVSRARDNPVPGGACGGPEVHS